DRHANLRTRNRSASRRETRASGRRGRSIGEPAAYLGLLVRRISLTFSRPEGISDSPACASLACNKYAMMSAVSSGLIAPGSFLGIESSISMNRSDKEPDHF